MIANIVLSLFVSTSFKRSFDNMAISMPGNRTFSLPMESNFFIIQGLFVAGFPERVQPNRQCVLRRGRGHLRRRDTMSLALVPKHKGAIAEVILILIGRFFTPLRFVQNDDASFWTVPEDLKEALSSQSFFSCPVRFFIFSMLIFARRLNSGRGSFVNGSIAGITDSSPMSPSACIA